MGSDRLILAQNSPSLKKDSLELREELFRSYHLVETSDTAAAMKLLKKISVESGKNRYWKIFFDAELSLARLHEQQGDLNDVVRDYIELIRELEKNDQFELLADAYYALGAVYQKYELLNKAIDYFSLSRDYHHKSDNIREEIRTLDVLGRLNLEIGEYDRAEAEILHAIKLSESMDGGIDISPYLKKLVLIYQFIGDEHKMLEINQELFDIAKEKSDLLEIGRSLTDLGFNYSALKAYDKALKHFKDAYFTYSILRQPDHVIAEALTNIGLTYHHQEAHLTAIDTLRSALRLWETEQRQDKISETCNMIARIYLLEEDYREAERFASLALEAAQKASDIELMQNSYQTFSEIYQGSNDFEEALTFYKKYLNLKDSIQLIRSNRKAVISQREFTAEKVEKEFALIIADQEMKDLIMEQLRLETEASQKEIELLRRNQELQELENERALQELLLTQQQLEAEKKNREINELVQQGEVQQLELARKEAEEQEHQKTIELLQQRNTVREQAMERNILRRRLLFLTIGLLIIVMGLIILGYLQKRRDNKRLSMQKDTILKANKELEEKNRKIATQKDEMERSFAVMENTLDKLKKTQKQLLEAEKMASIGQIAAGIAHEINNPINFVSSNVSPLKMNLQELREVLDAYRQAMNENGVDESRLERAREIEKKYDLQYVLEEIDLLLKGITEGTSRTREIVKGLRIFSRVDQHDLKRADIHEGIDSTLIILQNTYKNKIGIRKEYDDRIGPIHCYPGQLNQVFMNILTNAIQAIDEKGVITIKTRKIKSRVVIWISDTGKGMPRDIRTRIFEPFFTTKDVGEGTGLGLSISYGIIQQHKGEIKVSSKPGKGTTFKISLPINQEPE